MAHTYSILIDGRRCPAPTHCTVLEVLQQAELKLPTACRNGACGVCRLQLKSGRVSYRGRTPHGLWQQDIAEGVFLPCIAYADSDLDIQTPHDTSDHDITG